MSLKISVPLKIALGLVVCQLIEITSARCLSLARRKAFERRGASSYFRKLEWNLIKQVWVSL